MEVEWGASKAASNLKNHGVDFADAAAVLLDDMALTILDDSVDEEDRFVTLGVDAIGRPSGRCVHVAWGPSEAHLRPTSHHGRTTTLRKQEMKKEYDFRQGKRGAIIKTPSGNTRITIRIDEDILQWFRDQVHAAGGGNYQTLINSTLREYVDRKAYSLKDTLRSVVREELVRYGRKVSK